MRIIYPNPMAFPNQKANSVQVIQTCRALADCGHETHLLVSRLKYRRIAECLSIYGLRPHPNLTILAPEKSGRKSYYGFLMKHLGAFRYDPQTLVYLRNKDASRFLLRRKKRFGLPCIFESHSLKYLVQWDRLKRGAERPLRLSWVSDAFTLWRYYRLDKAIYRHADGIVCQTRGIKTILMQKHKPTAPMTVVHSGTTLMPPVTRRGKTILYLGQLYPVKGVDVLIRALAFLPRRRLIIVGGNRQQDIDRVRSLAFDVGVQDRIAVTGYVPHKHIDRYFRQAGVAVLPIMDVLETRLFTSPLKLFEYMAAGLPIVASDLPSIREILKNGKSGVLVAPNHPRKLAAGIEQVLKDDGYAGRLAAAALAAVRNYSWEHRAQNLARYLNRRLDGR